MQYKGYRINCLEMLIEKEINSGYRIENSPMEASRFISSFR